MPTFITPLGGLIDTGKDPWTLQFSKRVDDLQDVVLATPYAQAIVAFGVVDCRAMSLKVARLAATGKLVDMTAHGTGKRYESNIIQPNAEDLEKIKLMPRGGH